LLAGEGQAFERREIIALFRQLEKAGCGQFVEGRRGWPSRFVWSVGLTGVGRAAAGDAQPIAQILSDENGSRQGGDGKATVSQLDPNDDEEGVEELGETGGTGLEEEIEPDDGGFASEITQPFDPAKIRVETKPMSIQLLLDRIRHKEIDLAPGFQRKGGIWTARAKSRLIESLLIRIPLPAFYMDGSDEGRWLVVDGLQRLSTLESFTLDKTLRLTGLEFLEDYNGKTFDKLPRNLQRRILETQVTVFLIQENTPPEVKFTIFKRINTGGLPLSSQEIRHALNQGKASALLQTLAESAEFKTATSNGIRDERMGDRECVLRLLAFMSTSLEQYTANNLDSFLNQRMADFNRLSDSELQGLDRRFRRAMVDCHRIFGDRAFRKKKRGSSRRFPINRALFEVWAANVEALTPGDVDRLVELGSDLQDRFLTLLEDPKFDSSISYGTGDPRKVEIRFTGVRGVIRETLQ